MSGANETVSLSLVANMDISQVLGGVKAIQNGFNGLKIDPKIMGDLTKEFSNLQGYVKEFQKIMGKENISKTDIKNLQNLEKSINSSFSNVIKLQQQLNGSQIMSKVDSSQLDELVRKTEAARTALNDAFSNIKFGENSGILQLESGIEKAVGRSKTLKAAFTDAFTNLKTGNVDQFVSKIDGAFNNLEGKLKSGKLETTAQGLIKTFQQLGLINIDIKTDTAEQKINALKLGFEGIKTAIANGASGNEIQQLIQNLERATNEENEFRQVALQNGQISMGRLAEDTNRVAAGARDAAKAEREFQSASLSATQQVQQLQQSAQYFFSLRNMINLLKQGLREAVSTVKELDAAMTETAVVTNFSVGDMWKKLPEYTANANALGATVKDMYESTTLYYQQGLNTEQSMSIASETMKMARIAGLDAADATDKMTAALRGFNMEINEASAQRINDVYSNLAAKTASNTEELGTAMQRTASIAASAGMSFEGTAAFLAQAIETTREPAENIGTAMKTIIARMQEMKKNPLEIGEVDGEEVNYNKIDAALRSIGISLKAANGDFRDNDEVLLDISQRWDSLTQTQQRYIATSIAGSRQQSRFIAMVSDYGRTLELMDYANNAEGASQEQFGKTLDSLEAKLNKFQNAWKKFLMNIMNDSWTKGIVDGATSILNTVTKLIDTLSFENKGLKSILSIATAFTALKVGGRGINALIGGLGGLVDPKVGLKEGFRTGAFGGQAAKISNPIVKAIYSLIPHIDKAAANNLQYKGYGDFKGAKQELNKQFNPLSLQKNNGLIGIDDKNKYSLSGIQDIFSKSGINEAQQKALYASYPGLKHNMTKTLAKALQESGADSETTRGLIAGFKDGSLTSAQVLEKAGLVKSFSTQMKDIGEKSGQEAANAFRRAETKELVSGGLDKKLVQRGKDLGYSGKDLTNYVRGELDKRVNTKVYASNAKAQEILDTQHTLLKSEQLANGFGRVGGALTSAGMSLQMFGAQISAVHPVIGAVITQLGGLVTALGALPNIVSSIAAGGPVVWGITAAVVALGAAFYKAKKHVDGIKKSADKAVKSFKDTNKQTQDNIASLKTYMTQANYWSQNVDKNGYNVGLGDDEYKQYLDAVDKIAELNPDVVKGYNAQGHAIVDINSALKDTIKLEKQRQEEATEEYLKDSTGDKINKARDVNKDFLKVTREANSASTGAWRVTNWLGTELIDKNFGTDWFSHAVTPFQKQVGEIVDSLKSEISNPDEFYKQFSIDYNKLLSQDEQEIYRFVKNRNDIYSKALEANGGELSDKITNKFTDLDDLSEKFDAATQDQKEWLNTYVSSLDSFKDIPEELKGSVLEGLDHIAIQPNLNFSDMQDQADTMLSTFDNLTREGGDYQKAMEDVAKAQESFASSMDPSEYANKTRKALSSLDKLYQQYAKDTSTYGQAVAEFLQNQIDQIEKFPEEGSITLAEALNTHASEVQGAEGAFAAFQESTKSDFATGAENMKSIYDEIVKETDGIQLHLQGDGDNTLWTGMNSLFSKEAVDKAAADGESAVRSMLDRVEPMLQEGQAGFDAFWTDMFSPERVEALKDIEGLDIDPENWEIKWDEDINPDVFHEMAKELGYSDSFLASMLNKGRQFADLDFMDMSQVRKALSTDDAAIKGTTTTTVTNDKGEQETITDRYVKEDYLRNALAEAQIVNPQEQNEAIEKMADEGVKIIPGADSITPKELNNLGIKDMSSAITTLGDTGQFNRNEIEEYAKNLKDFNPEEFGTLYDDYLASQEHPELPTLTSIEGNVATIASIIGSNRVEKGYADESTIAAYEEAKKLVNGENGWRKGKADSISELFALGKNKEGKRLTDAEYKTTSELLDKQIKAYEKQADLAEKGAKKAEEEGRQTDADELSKEAAGYAELARRLLLDKEQGEKNYSEQERRDKEATDKESKGKDYSDKEKSNWEKSNITPEEYVKAREAGRKNEQESEKPREETPRTSTKGTTIPGVGYVDDNGTVHVNRQPTEDPKTTAKKEAQEGLSNFWNELKQSATEEATKTNPSAATQEQVVSTDQVIGEINRLYGGVLSGIDPSAITMNPEAQATLDMLYSNAVNSGTTVLTDGLMTQMQSMGIDIQQAINSGLVIDSNGIYASAQQKSKEGTDALEKGLEEGPSEVDTSTGAKSAADTVKKGVETTVQAAVDAVNSVKIPQPKTPAEGEGTGQTESQQQLSVTYEAKITNTGEMLASINQQIDKVLQSASEKKRQVTAQGTVKVNYAKGKQAKASNQNAKVNYTKGKQEKAEDKDALVNYKLGSQTPPSSPKSAFVNYTLGSQDEPKDKTAKVYYVNGSKSKSNPGEATGARNHGYAPAPHAGSAARGNYGQVGPKGKGGLTLTGELGYEIAWIPSENRSMILGANGPQMVNLPGDTVVWTHEQSKKILKQKAIPAGSHSGEGKYIPSTTTVYTPPKPSKPKTTSTNKDNKDDKDTTKTVNKLAGKISVWWENQVRKVDAYTRKMDKNADEFAKILKKGGGTLSSAQSVIKAYKKSINQTININKTSLKQANKELKNLDTKKSNYAISYKSGKDTKKEKVNLAGYIKYDKASGTYIIDPNAINKAASKNKERAKAIKDVAEKTLNEKLGRKKTAEDNIKKAQDALDKLNDEVYQTFYSWEKSINRVYVLSQKLEKLEKKAGIYDAKESLVYSELEAGKGQNSKVSKAVFDLKYNAARERNNIVNTIETSRLALGAARDEFNAAKNLDTYRKIYNKNKGSAQALVDWKGAQEAIKLFNKYNGDYDKAIKALNEKNYNETTYNKIKEILDKIHEKETALLDATEAAYKSIQDLYDRIEEDQQTIADFENELLDAIIDQAEKRIDQVEKLNSALTNQFKRLIDEVKRNLDERRKKEDNQKTEDDLAKKQQRLALLRADTSGGNALEIARLEQEIFEGRQGYQRTLEDQLLDKLTQQGDKAADQRERQISLLHGQHEIAKATGVYVKQVATWMSNPNKYMSQIKNAWLTQKGYDEATNTNREQLNQNFNKTIVQVQVAMADLKASINKLKETGANGDENYADIQAGLTAKEIKTLVNEKGKHLFNASVFKNAGYSAKTLKDSGIYTDKEIINAGYTKAQLAKAGITAKTLKKNKISAATGKKAGYTAKDLLGAGYTPKELKKAGYTAQDFKNSKINIKKAQEAKFSKNDIAKAYGATAAMTTLNMSGRQTQSATGASAKAMQKIVNKSSKDNAKQEDMAGVQVGKVTIDTNGSKKGGNKTINDAHISADGHTAGANIGSTLYTADWDETTGTIKGKWKKIPIGKLTPALIKKYPIDGKQALERAIENTKIGGKINNNFKSLVTAAGIVGKTYKLKNGIQASIDGNGNIHYNKGTEGVQVWYPATGKLTLRKFNKANFKKWAASKNVGREYTQVNEARKKKKLSSFKTGGLADFTGPAWLDGTKSKPELVLNSTDTKNFIALRDVLNQALRSTSSINNSYGGDATYEININVDHINSDYDVDKIAERVKRNIVKDSSYRNVTQVRKFR